ncbi:MAG: response regulator transcription factor [Chloroflexi bacterium]|nr:response regulator transcription factor [Chloroflexota bacterium]
MKVLIVDDSKDVLDTLGLTFKIRWPEVVLFSATTGAQGVQIAESESPDVIILDINLPGTDGFETLKQLRLFSDVPIIMLSVRDDELDIVRCLEAGADDYITKPFKALDLLARVAASLRRSGISRRDGEDLPMFTAGELNIDFNAREATLRGQHIHLTPIEWRLVQMLVRNAGRVVTHKAIRSKVWGTADYVDPSTVKKNIAQLRRKLGDTPGMPTMIINDRSVGYKFVKLA